MARTLTSVLLGVFCMTSLFAQKPANLCGNWQIKSYNSTLRDSALASRVEKNCPGLLVLNINKKGKMKFIFTDKKDSVIFTGKIKFKNNGSMQISNNILQSTYLGELEKCVTAELREDLRKIFVRAFACTVEKDKLMFYYNTPADRQHKKTMVLARLTGEKVN